ncbi:hypothetical protein AB0D12_13115 [Streptomyces sp. NPDC048479]|uniref:three-helix bundle dimerization domain-containing protein n=1 Tax=Streptomyces sp. NPDC048479 TaxID=3154725 RepID=UPI003416D280
MSPPSSPVLPDQRLFAGAPRLAARHEGRFSAETVQHLLADSYTRLATVAKIQTHLVMLAERLAAERLDALAKVEGAPGSGIPRVLFVMQPQRRPLADRRRTPGAPRRRPRGGVLRRQRASRKGRPRRRPGARRNRR